MSFPPLDPALPAGTNAQEQARLLRRIHEALLAGRPSPAPLRPVIEDSWKRMPTFGIDPESGPPPRVTPPDELHHNRSEEHTSELQSRFDLVCRLLLE